jgi:hypothetical protein
MSYADRLRNIEDAIISLIYRASLVAERNKENFLGLSHYDCQRVLVMVGLSGSWLRRMTDDLIDRGVLQVNHFDLGVQLLKLYDISPSFDASDLTDFLDAFLLSELNPNSLYTAEEVLVTSKVVIDHGVGRASSLANKHSAYLEHKIIDRLGIDE